MPSSEKVIIEVLLDTIYLLGGAKALLEMQSNKNIDEILELLNRIRMGKENCSDEAVWPPCFASLDAVQKGNGSVDDERVLTHMIEPWLGAVGSLKEVDLLNILRAQLNDVHQPNIY